MMEDTIPAYKITRTMDEQQWNVLDHQYDRVKRADIQFADGSSTFVIVPFTDDWHEAIKEEAQRVYEQHASVMQHQGPDIPRPQRPQSAQRGTIGMT